MKFLNKNKINLEIGYFLFSVFTLWLILILYSINLKYELRLFYNIIYFIGDACLLLSPMWLLGRRSRWYAVPVIWLVAFYLVATAIYFRFWGELLPLVSVFNTSNWNHFVFESAWHKISGWDVAILAVAMIYTVLVFLYRANASPGTPLRHKYRIIGFSGAIMTWMLTTAVDYVHSYRYCVWFNTEHHTQIKHTFNSYLDLKVGPSAVMGEYMSFNSGLIWYLARQFNYIRLANNRLRLSEDDVNEIKETISRQSALTSLADSATGSLMTGNKNKNLIFIIVESLNAKEIGYRADGISITPVLDSLIKAPGTVAATLMFPQIKSGGSSDGQLIYNTGLLPIESGITVQQYDGNIYKSLAGILNKKHSAEFIVENGSIWNHRATTKAFGYDRLYEMDDLQRSGLYNQEKGADHAVFTFALRHLRDMPMPFLAEITTLSMHFPFEDMGVPGLENGKNDIGIEQRYHLSLKYFDTELGQFLAGLKRQGLYDNSIIIIASDHDLEFNGNTRGTLPICFIALNTGITKHITTRTWQADVFPTVLDIMGVDTGGGYRGLGHSLLSDSIPERDDAYWTPVRTVSDRIIRSDYFNRN